MGGTGSDPAACLTLRLLGLSQALTQSPRTTPCSVSTWAAMQTIDSVRQVWCSWSVRTTGCATRYVKRSEAGASSLGVLINSNQPSVAHCGFRGAVQSPSVRDHIKAERMPPGQSLDAAARGAAPYAIFSSEGSRGCCRAPGIRC